MSLSQRSLSQLLAVLCGLAAAAWIGAAALTAGRGFDISDEGYYLLSYRWWDTNFATFTGVQYVYGPVFELLGYDIAGLRLVRLLSVVGVHIAFGWSFMGWLRLRRPSAPDTRWWEIAGTAAIVAAAGLVYGWLPLSPGYNDVSLLGGMLAAAILLAAATRVDKGQSAPLWLPAALGPVVVGMLLAKWTSSAVVCLLIGLAAIILLRPRHDADAPAAARKWRAVRAIALFAAATIGSAVLTVVVMQLFVAPLTTAVPEMLKINKLVAAQTNSPTVLLQMYWETTVNVLLRAGKRHFLLLLAVLVALIPRAKWWAVALAVGGLAMTGRDLITHRGMLGGTVNLYQYPVSLIGMAAVTVVAGLGVVIMRRSDSSLTREGLRGWVVFAMLAALPLAQAMGTGNPLYFMAINAFAAWMALVIAMVTGIEGAPAVARTISLTMATAIVLVCGSIAATGLWNYPYRTVGHAQADQVAAGVAPLDSLKLDRASAAGYSKLNGMLAPYQVPGGRAMMAFDEMPGVILMLGGRPIGEAWFSATDHARSAAGIRAHCENGVGSWGTHKPILIFNRPMADTEVDALRSCGLVFATDYRLLAPKEETMGLSVYIPATEPIRGQS